MQIFPLHRLEPRFTAHGIIDLCNCRYISIEAKQEAVPYPHVAAVTVLFFVASATTACIVTDLGIVFQLIGGLAGSLLIFILPGGLILADWRASAHRRTGAAANGAYGAPGAHHGSTTGDGVRDAARPSLEGYRMSASLHEHPFDHDAHLSAAAEHSPAGGTLDSKPCYECALDQAWVGALLVILGSAVAALTVYTSLKQYLRPSAGDDLLLHAGMPLNSTLAGSG